MIAQSMKDGNLRRVAPRIALTVFEHRQSKNTLGSTNVRPKL